MLANVQHVANAVLYAALGWCVQNGQLKCKLCFEYCCIFICTKLVPERQILSINNKSPLKRGEWGLVLREAK